MAKKISKNTPPPLPDGGQEQAPPKREKRSETMLRTAREKVDSIKGGEIPAYPWNKEAVFMLVCSIVVAAVGAVAKSYIFVAAAAVGVVVNIALLLQTKKIKAINTPGNYLQAMELSRKVGKTTGVSFFIGSLVTVALTTMLFFHNLIS